MVSVCEAASKFKISDSVTHISDVGFLKYPMYNDLPDLAIKRVLDNAYKIISQKNKLEFKCNLEYVNYTFKGSF